MTQRRAGVPRAGLLPASRPHDWTAPLAEWLEGRESLPPLDFFATAKADLEFGAFIALVKAEPLHDAGDFSAQSLQRSWDTNHAYVSRALEIVRPDAGHINLDREECRMVREELGAPPPACLPLYFIAVGAGGSEELVYVGKTSSETSRFASGHHAFTRLLHPQYDGKPKRIYQAQVVLTVDSGATQQESRSDYFPLEWVHPFALAAEYLDSIESQLIFDLQPVLNTNKKRRYSARHAMALQVLNYVTDSRFLHQLDLYPPADGTPGSG